MMTRVNGTETSVLIVGGSLNGLTAALLLAHRKVPCVVVERHPQTTLQYKFRGISPRSMEIYRGLGIENDIRAHDLIDDTSAYVARMPNLAASEVGCTRFATSAETPDENSVSTVSTSAVQRLMASPSGVWSKYRTGSSW